MENGGWVEDVLETGTTYTLRIDIIWTVILEGLNIMALYGVWIHDSIHYDGGETSLQELKGSGVKKQNIKCL